MKEKRVAVLRGGPSEEYAVSMQTGAAVLEALRSTGYPAKDIAISRSGEWLDEGMVKTPDQALQAVDVVFLALHGTYGEDGTVQKILERKHIPFTGSRSFPSAMALNKELTKNFLKQFEVRSPKHFRVTREGVTDPVSTAESIKKLFGPKYVVKPIGSGSSLGVEMVDREIDLAFALTNALTENEVVLVEEKIEGKEATVGVAEKFRGEGVYALPVIEIVPPANASFFDATVKYDGSTQEICPGRFSTEEKLELERLARLVHDRLNLQQYSRSDFIVSRDGVYFLEVNTLPGLTAESLLPKAFNAVGSTYVDMVTYLVETARV